MSRWALVIGGTVATVVESEAAPLAQLGGQWVADPSGQAQAGGGHAGGTFSAPAGPAQVRHLTPLAFARRFTQAERVTLEIAALDDPAASMSARQGAAALRVYLADVQTASYIDLDRADTRAGVQQLEALTLLGTGRAAEILDAPVQAHERP